ncbi:RNase adapter RapZ [bacterium]|nr:RNase adapter RapZ [bacterium]MBU1153637.1 RNase adapter RapZ [bacterium]MBU2599432.1 RNase adapter RapZ [bacterium]
MKTKFIIITGLSGAGKSLVVKCLEDLNFFCVDNLPTALVPKFVELCGKPESKIDKIVLVIDIREGEFLENFFDVLNNFKTQNITYKVLFLDASNEVITRRFNETRRRHPLFLKTETLIESINKEREILQRIRESADIIIDTTNLTPNELHHTLKKAISPTTKETLIPMNISIVSFGYRFGIPNDADLVFDVRFLLNPHYIEELSHLTGDDLKVSDFILNHDLTKIFVKKFKKFIFFLIPQYIEEGKTYLTIAIGCTGGRHRSVVIANLLSQEISKKKYKVNLITYHRDIYKK